MPVSGFLRDTPERSVCDEWFALIGDVFNAALIQIAQAGALDKNGNRGPLTGVPFGAKDIIDTCDYPDHCRSRLARV